MCPGDTHCRRRIPFELRVGFNTLTPDSNSVQEIPLPGRSLSMIQFTRGLHSSRTRAMLAFLLVAGLALGCGDDGEPLFCLDMDNPGFEDFAGLDFIEFSIQTGADCFGNPFCVIDDDPIPGWSISGDSSTWAGSWNSQPNFFVGDAPEGDQIAHLATMQGETRAISQILEAVVEPNTRYVLTVEVGQRLDVIASDFGVELRADGDLLAEDENTFMPPSGQFLRSTVTYETGDMDLLEGENLEIWLLGSRSGAAGASIHFDDVCLTAEPI